MSKIDPLEQATRAMLADYGGPRAVKALIRQARSDSDPISVNVIGDSLEDCDGAVVVLRGNATVRCFHEWAVRTRSLTAGKPITSEQAES